MTDKNPLISSLTLVSKVTLTAGALFFYIHYFFPQSWRYFTMDPKLPLISIYSIKNGSLNDQPVIKTNMNYGMGVSRKGLILYDELAKLSAPEKNIAWKKLNRDSLPFIIMESHDILSVNDDKLGIGKGRFLLIKTERVLFKDFNTRQKIIPVEYYTLTDVQ